MQQAPVYWQKGMSWDKATLNSEEIICGLIRY